MNKMGDYIEINLAVSNLSLDIFAGKFAILATFFYSFFAGYGEV